MLRKGSYFLVDTLEVHISLSNKTIKEWEPIFKFTHFSRYYGHAERNCKVDNFSFKFSCTYACLL